MAKRMEKLAFAFDLFLLGAGICKVLRTRAGREYGLHQGAKNTNAQPLRLTGMRLLQRGEVCGGGGRGALLQTGVRSPQL